MWILHKRSLPNAWKKEIATEEACVELLREQICHDCLKGILRFVSDEEEDIFQGIPPNLNNLDDLLSTPCGLEFEVICDDKSSSYFDII